MACLLAGSASAATGSGGAIAGTANGGGSVHSTRTAHTLSRGARGHAVRVLQDRLTRAGFPTPVAGIFGPLTETSVRAFQRQQKLKVDGVVTARVAAALKRALRSHVASEPPVETPPPVSPANATLLPDGTAVAPPQAPAAVAAVVAAANQIATKPYRWGGGHQHWQDSGYDCSGSVSFALHGAGLLDVSMTSGELMAYGAEGSGQWITIYANADHVYMVVAGLRYDTSGAKPSRWQAEMRTTLGYTVRHPAGY